jgi:hypothetical protein
MKVTHQQIALWAGVSEATVRKVLRGCPTVSPDTVARVQRAVAELENAASAQTPLPEAIARKIYVIRSQWVMLDVDLAQLFGTRTRRINQQVCRHRERFPEDFVFQLSPQEFRDWKQRLAALQTGRGGRRNCPWAFTEQGVAMLSSVLRSPAALKVNVEILRAFVQLQRLLATPGELITRITQLAETVQLHDGQIKVITEALRPAIGLSPKGP